MTKLIDAGKPILAVVGNTPEQGVLDYIERLRKLTLAGWHQSTALFLTDAM